MYSSHKDEYIDLLQLDNYQNIKLFNKNRNNIVNSTALGETILIYKYNNTELKNKDIRIYHDEINMVQQYISHYWKEDNLKFINSENECGIQLADNMASIIGNLISKFLPIINDRDLSKKIREDNSWNRKKLKTTINNNMKHLKLVMTMRERAALMTYIKSKTTNVSDFKRELHMNLDYIFFHEIENNMTLNQAMKIFRR